MLVLFFGLGVQLQLATCAISHQAELPVSPACMVQTKSVTGQLGVHKQGLIEDIQDSAQCIENYRQGLNEVQAGLGNYVQDDSFRVANVSDKPMVLGAGFGTTGTTSFMAALKKLKLKTSHCCDVPGVTDLMAPLVTGGLMTFAKTRKLTDQETQDCLVALSTFDYRYLEGHYDALLDTPVAEVFLYLWKTYPNARVILTKRNASDWIEHRLLTHRWNGFKPMQNPCGQFLGYPDLFSREQYHKMYELHSELVRCVVPQDQLMEINIFEMSDEAKSKLLSDVANFINVPVPEDQAFPKVLPHAIR